LVFVLFVIAAEISFQHTRILCYPFRHSIILTSGWFCPLPCWQILSRSGTWNACVVSCRITRCSFYFVPFNCDEKEAERFLMALRLHLTKRNKQKWLRRIIRPRLPLPAFSPSPVFVCFFLFEFTRARDLKKQEPPRRFQHSTAPSTSSHFLFRWRRHYRPHLFARMQIRTTLSFSATPHPPLPRHVLLLANFRHLLGLESSLIQKDSSAQVWWEGKRSGGAPFFSLFLSFETTNCLRKL
jgi:hypothetical protein